MSTKQSSFLLRFQESGLNEGPPGLAAATKTDTWVAKEKGDKDPGGRSELVLPRSEPDRGATLAATKTHTKIAKEAPDDDPMRGAYRVFPNDPHPQ